jgi:hypothetical protein
MKPIIAIKGGLGNQLFQWVYAHQMSANGNFKVNLFFSSAEPNRKFDLTSVSRQCGHVHKRGGKILDFRPKFFLRAFDKLWDTRWSRKVAEVFGYVREDPRFDQQQTLKLPKKIRYANGYFQSEAFISKASPALEKELDLAVDFAAKSIFDKLSINRPYSVMHVRRGDYEQNFFTPTIIGSLADDYFLRWRESNPSDYLILLVEDLKDATELIKLVKPQLMLDNLTTSAWDCIGLMAEADKVLASNSSLSWWGAWFCSKRGGVATLPSSWSYWGNVKTENFHFQGCEVSSSVWRNTQ